MTEWDIVTVLAAVVGLFAAVGAPVIRLNATMTRLSALVEQLEKKVEKQGTESKESHRRLWAHNDEQDEKLNDHEKRITILERKD